MTLAARAVMPPARKTGRPCSVGLLLETLPEGESVALRTMLDDTRRESAAIEFDLRDEGHYVGSQQVARHRRGVCRCALPGRD